MGVDDALLKAGCRNGDEVRILGFAFAFDGVEDDDDEVFEDIEPLEEVTPGEDVAAPDDAAGTGEPSGEAAGEATPADAGAPVAEAERCDGDA